MSAPLYTLEILRLAAATAETPRLADPSGSAERRSRTCGSVVTVDVKLDADGRVTAFGHQVNACALGQASATVLARHAVGANAGEVAALAAGITSFFDGTREALPDWPDIDILARAKPYPARHAAVRLPFEAAVAAIKDARR